MFIRDVKKLHSEVVLFGCNKITEIFILLMQEWNIDIQVPSIQVETPFICSLFFDSSRRIIISRQFFT